MKPYLSKLLNLAARMRLFRKQSYFCSEPWTGIFSVRTNRDVVFCPCYLQLKIGNLSESSMQDIWNSSKLVELRKSFSRGELPEICSRQLCPVAREKES
jgi:radical SAM protein with 4Fe4S-binding SPASM domain